MAIDTIKSTAVLDGAITTADLANDIAINTSGAITTTGAFTSKGIDDNADATALRIDSNEKVLIGKTSAGYNVDGFEAHPNGETYVSRSGTPMAINRNSSDGTILNFYKDGTGVGSIGNNSGGLYIGSGDAGVTIESTLDAIIPTNVATGSYTDNALDLGYSTKRFKDAYLSGGIYLGGTDADHKLDDYEQGSWTPTLKGANAPTGENYNVRLGTYTKIGQMVYIQCYVSVLSLGSNMTGTYGYISGFPFTIAPGSDQYSTGSFPYVHSLGQNVNSLHAYGNQGTTQAYVTYLNGAGTTSSYLSPSGWGSTPTIMFGMTYFTDT